MEPVEPDQTLDRLKLTELALSVFAYILVNDGVMDAVACVYSENIGRCVVHGLASKSERYKFRRQVQLTAAATRATSIAVMWPNVHTPNLTIPVLYHSRGHHPHWTYLGVAQGVEIPKKTSAPYFAQPSLNFWWHEKGWWTGEPKSTELTGFQLPQEMPTDKDAELAFSTLCAGKSKHGKLVDLLKHHPFDGFA